MNNMRKSCNDESWRGRVCRTLAPRPLLPNKVERPYDSELRMLVSAVTTLYSDRTRPHVRDIQRRLMEKKASREFLNTGFVKLCQDRNDIFDIKEFDKQNGCVFLRAKPECEFKWVDPLHPRDVYPAQLWRDMMAFIVEIQTLDHMKKQKVGSGGYRQCGYHFKGGRYGMASEMKRCDLEFIHGMCPGRVCHIVQLAVSRGWLAYENDMLQPIAACKVVSSSILRQATPLKDMDLKKHSLRVSEDYNEICLLLVQSLRRNKNRILLSQLRRLFAVEHNITLCSTIFGVRKLSALLEAKEYPFHKVCRIETDGKQHVVVGGSSVLRFEPREAVSAPEAATPNSASTSCSDEESTSRDQIGCIPTTPGKGLPWQLPRWIVDPQCDVQGEFTIRCGSSRKDSEERMNWNWANNHGYLSMSPHVSHEMIKAEESMFGATHFWPPPLRVVTPPQSGFFIEMMQPIAPPTGTIRAFSDVQLNEKELSVSAQSVFLHSFDSGRREAVRNCNQSFFFRPIDVNNFPWRVTDVTELGDVDNDLTSGEKLALDFLFTTPPENAVAVKGSLNDDGDMMSNSTCYSSSGLSLTEMSSFMESASVPDVPEHAHEECSLPLVQLLYQTVLVPLSSLYEAAVLAPTSGFSSLQEKNTASALLVDINSYGLLLHPGLLLNYCSDRESNTPAAAGYCTGDQLVTEPEFCRSGLGSTVTDKVSLSPSSRRGMSKCAELHLYTKAIEGIRGEVVNVMVPQTYVKARSLDSWPERNIGRRAMPNAKNCCRVVHYTASSDSVARPSTFIRQLTGTAPFSADGLVNYNRHQMKPMSSNCFLWGTGMGTRHFANHVHTRPSGLLDQKT